MKRLNENYTRIIINILACIGVISLGFMVWGSMHEKQSQHKKHKDQSAIHSQYAGQEDRGIKALSQDDIKSLLKGAGTPFGGMAKPAELNGYPGPRHVLDAFIAGEFTLTHEQKNEIEIVYEDMKSKAIVLGKQIIDIEKNIDEAFVNSIITENHLSEQTSRSADLYGQLRLVHLKSHLSMVEILSPKQVSQYNELRGYSSDNPCKNVPAGHDPELWKLHNSCQ